MENQKTSQTEIVLQHLKQFKKITSWEAITEYGITRLSAVIFNLRALEYDIDSVQKKGTNRLGHKVTFTEYTLRENENDRR